MPLHLLVPRDEIEGHVRSLAERLNRDYRGLRPLFLGVLKGSYIFLADLTRQLEEPPEVDFIMLSTYGRKGDVASPTKVLLHPSANLAGRHVVIVEDIIDSGRTLNYLLEYVARRQPATVRICALLARESTLKAGCPAIDYLGRTVGDGWLVGYGLDAGERYRTLPDVHRLEEES
jgi:hypoxanthine phosphoribosyltransferase